MASAAPSRSMYYVLAAVGLFTLIVGASVRLRRPRDQATLHFFWLCVAFFGVFTFSFNGPFDRLDWVFFWGDAVAMALLPALLLHFTLVFPERQLGRSTAADSRLDSSDVSAGADPGCGARVVVDDAGHGRRSGVLAHGRTARPGRARLPVPGGIDRSLRARPRIRRDHVADRAASAALDCVGNTFSASAPLRSVTRCRGRSASIRRSRSS